MSVQVVAGRVLGVLRRVHVVRMRQVSVMSGLMMVAGVVMFGGFGVMMRSHTVMMGRLAMLVRCLL